MDVVVKVVVVGGPCVAVVGNESETDNDSLVVVDNGSVTDHIIEISLKT